MTHDYLAEVRQKASNRLKKLRSTLPYSTLDTNACVYATGSYGRLEAGERSDLDVFIVSRTTKDIDENTGRHRRLLTKVEEIKLQGSLISAAEELGLPKFDGDGKFLNCHGLDDYVRFLGSPEDDAKNTLTGRLLLLLESRPIVGCDVYDELIDAVIAKYFLDYEQNRNNFLPAFLINDILRMWRTFCVNYEYSRKQDSIKSKLKNLKLKYCRMLTCYSAVVYFLDVFSTSGTITKQDVKKMISLTPTERFENVSVLSAEKSEERGGLAASIELTLSLYADFLKFTHDVSINEKAPSEDNLQEWREKSYEFGSTMEQIVTSFKDSPSGAKLFRLVLI